MFAYVTHSAYDILTVQYRYVNTNKSVTTPSPSTSIKVIDRRRSMSADKIFYQSMTRINIPLDIYI